MRSSLAAALVYGALLNAPLPPRSGPLCDDVRHAPSFQWDDKTKTVRGLPGYGLYEPQLIGDWVVCVLWHGQRVPDRESRETRLGLVAVNLKSGQARQLNAPENRGVECERTIPLKSVECGVVLSKPRVAGGKQDAAKDRSFWKWSPQTGAVVAGGPWTPTSILDFVVGPGICEVATVGGRTSAGANVRIREIRSGKATEFFLDNDAKLLADLEYFIAPAAQTLVQLAGGRSFIVMHRPDDTNAVARDSLISECVDPTARDGRRWRLRADQIKETVGQMPTDVYPIPGIGRTSPVLGMAVASGEGGTMRTDCLTISSQSGAILKSWRIDELTRALISVDGKLMACTVEGEKREGLIFDVATGTVVSKLDLSNHLGVSLVAFQDAQHILGRSHNELWRFAIAPQKTHDLLFRLDPSASDW